MSDLPGYVIRNRQYWDRTADQWVEPGRRAWAGPPTWGIWEIPESQLHAIPPVAGLDTIELGCGTAYISSWLARDGARPVAIDNSRNQLETARELQESFGIHFPLIHGNAETVPLPDASFDLAISEYGASIWCDPYRWIPEAARLLRPGGWLVFLTNSVISMLCMPEDEDEPAGRALLRDQFGMHRFEWPEDESVEFHLPHGKMIDLLHANGLRVQRLLELQAPEGAATRHQYVTPDWSRRWPSEEIWVAHKRS